VPIPLSLGGSPASHRPSGLVCSSDDSFVRGTRRPLLRGKLRSEGGIKMFGKVGVRLSGLAFVASHEYLERDLVTGKQYSLCVLQQRGLAVA
jgi:hypothetical protein